MQAEIRVAVCRGENGDPDSAPSYRCLDLFREPVAWLQALAVEERPEVDPSEAVVEQPCHVPLRVGPTVVDEHVAWGRLVAGSAAAGAEELAGDRGDSGGGWTLHVP